MILKYRILISVVLFSFVLAGAHVSAKTDKFKPIIVSNLLFQEKGLVGEFTAQTILEAKKLTLQTSRNKALNLFHKKNEEYKEVKTCSEYWNAKNAGYFAKTTVDMHMESPFIRTCGVLRQLESAKASEYSRFKGERYFWQQPDKLPARLLHFAKQERCEAGMSLRECLGSLDDGYVMVNAGSIGVGAKNMSTSCQEMAYADFNDDGYEDILLSCTIRATIGTYFVSRMYCLGYPEDAKLMHLWDCSGRYER